MSEGSRGPERPNSSHLEAHPEKPLFTVPTNRLEQKLDKMQQSAADHAGDVETYGRRAVLGGGILGIGAAANYLKSKFSHEAPQVEKEYIEPLHNDIIYVQRDPETQELSFSDVAEYRDAAFHGVSTSENPDGKIYVRSEHRVSSDEDKMQVLTESEINGKDIGVIRVAGIGGSDANGTNDDPYYCFRTSINGKPEFAYLWLALVKKTDDPDNPYIYVDGQGKESETPWFVGPKFVDTTVQQSSDNTDQ